MLSWKLSLRLDRKLLKKRLIGKHVIVVGGTSGLGLAISCEVVSAGASVSIIARGTKRSEADDPFENTKRKCLARKISDSQEVILFKADGSSYEQLVGALKLAYNDLGRPYWVINCAGVALPGYLRDQLPHIDLHHAPEAESQISSNYYTSLNLARAVTFLSSSAPELDSGHSDAFKDSSSPIYPSKIVFTGSVLSVMSFVGYSAYAASKYALKGLSDSLRSELLPYNVDVHICILGNIDTEAFVKEDRLKPSVTKLIEGKSTAQSPEYVASCVLAGLINNRYCITNEFLGEVFRMNGNNVAPRPNYISEVTHPFL